MFTLSAAPSTSAHLGILQLSISLFGESSYLMHAVCDLMTNLCIIIHINIIILTVTGGLRDGLPGFSLASCWLNCHLRHNKMLATQLHQSRMPIVND